MIFPQDKQFGAVSNSGCIEALHEHFRRSVEIEGFVLSSRLDMADVKSLMLEMFVASCGLDESEFLVTFLENLVFIFGRSEIRGPDADGGNLGFDAGLGSLW